MAAPSAEAKGKNPITLTPDLSFDRHVNTLKYHLAAQKREAILVGVRAGTLSVQRAVYLWKQWVEPKYAYACGMWIQLRNPRAVGLINRYQAEGAAAILGIASDNPSITDPPRCVLLREVGLHPAHVLHALGLVRFYRLVRSRPRDSLLRRTWCVIESHRADQHPDSINTALRQLKDAHPELDQQLPPAENKLDWKQLANSIAKKEIARWTNDQITNSHRMSEYAGIATELRARNHNPSCYPPYLTMDGLSKSERRNIAIFRMQCANYMHAHAGFKPSPLFQHPHLPFPERGCISLHCRHRTDGLGNAPIDSTGHVLLDCPAHAEARAALMQAIDSALAACGLTRDHDVTTRTRLICLLLGSPPPHTHERLLGHPTAYRDILRATARFIKSVHATRWLQHA